MRKIILSLLALAAVAAGSLFLAKVPPESILVPRSAQTLRHTPRKRAPDAVSIASFNIQAFGETKLGKPRVMEALTAVVRQFDIVAVQEIRAKHADVLPRFVALINQDGSQYDYVLGPRLGRTASKEQYAFVFDTTRVQIDRGTVYTVDDPADRLHREPLVTRFSARTPSNPFTFTLIDVHTDPDEVRSEVEALGDVFRAVQHDGSREDDVILLGDLNADANHLGSLARMSDMTCAIRGQPTNTHGTHAYDNLVFDRKTTAEFTGRSGVYDLVRELGLSLEEALQVSDHFPVWAEFSIHEAPAGPTAARPTSTPR